MQRQLLQHPPEKDRGVSAALIDKHAGVPAQQPADSNAPRTCGIGLPMNRQRAACPVSTGTSHDEGPLLAVVQIQHPPALEHGGVKGLGT